MRGICCRLGEKDILAQPGQEDDDCRNHMKQLRNSRKPKLNCEKLTKDMKDTGERSVLRRQVRLFSIRSVHLLHRPCESDSSVSKFLSAKQIINEFAKYCEE